ncbi:MAG: sugar phosphate isomerase/epimerase [Ruminococcaceae bacterium]|nr:sugar phosphate isomerase/epimerase [Oscillospiraceae bacterium]
MKYIISAFADEYSPNFDTQLSALKENNIPAIEPRNVSGTNISSLDDNQLEEVSKKVKAAGIKVSSIGSPLGKIKIDDPMQPHLELTERTCKIAKALDCKNIRMFSFYMPKDEKKAHRSEVLSRINAMLDIADSYGITLCHENEGGIYGEEPEMCFDLFEALGERMKCVFDMGNFRLGTYDPWEAYTMLKDKIEYFHIKDGTAKKEIVPPGLGEGRIADILSDFAKTADRDVYITLEPHLQTFEGLKKLTNSVFSYPYAYETAEEAFLDALKRLREMI